MDNYKFIQNRMCEYFPCHKISDEGEFNCLFCYCPLYTLGDKCGGDFVYTQSGVKSCMNCSKPHIKGGYEHVMSNIANIIQLAKNNREQL